MGYAKKITKLIKKIGIIFAIDKVKNNLNKEE